MKKFLALAAFLCFMSAAVGDSTSFTIHIIGDSTVCTYSSSAYPQTGWGQVLGAFFDDARVTINNVAIGGRSSKTFYTDGRLESLASSVNEGDFIFIQFGHNDRYFGTNARQVPVDSFAYYLQIYVDSAKAWGATPVFVSPMVMNAWSSGSLRNVFTEQDYRGVMKDLAETEQIPFVDLNMETYELYAEYGYDYITRFLFKYLLEGEYPNYPDGVDDGTTHFQETGSVGHAQIIAEQLEANLSSTTLSTASMTQLAILTSALKTRYDLTIQANISTSGLITKSQSLPEGAPFTLKAIPGDGETFLYWADDACDTVGTDSLIYNLEMLGRATTFTAMFSGGSECVVTNESGFDYEESSSSEGASSSSVVTSAWPSEIDMANPDEGEGTTDTNHEGYTGEGFFNIENAEGSTATYKLVSLQSASSAKILVRYCNGGTSSRPMTFIVDGFSYEVDFPVSASWTTWDTAYIEGVWLDAVEFDLEIVSGSSDGGPNIDMIAFDISGVSRVAAAASSSSEESFEDPASSSSEESLENAASSSSEGSGDSSPIFEVSSKARARFDSRTWSLEAPAGKLSVEVFNALGHKVAGYEGESSGGTLDLSSCKNSLRSGTYFVRALQGGQVLLKSKASVR